MNGYQQVTNEEFINENGIRTKVYKIGNTSINASEIQHDIKIKQSFKIETITDPIKLCKFLITQSYYNTNSTKGNKDLKLVEQVVVELNKISYLMDLQKTGDLTKKESKNLIKSIEKLYKTVHKTGNRIKLDGSVNKDSKEAEFSYRTLKKGSRHDIENGYDLKYLLESVFGDKKDKFVQTMLSDLNKTKEKVNVIKDAPLEEKLSKKEQKHLKNEEEKQQLNSLSKAEAKLEELEIQKIRKQNEINLLEKELSYEERKQDIAKQNRELWDNETSRTERKNYESYELKNPGTGDAYEEKKEGVLVNSLYGEAEKESIMKKQNNFVEMASNKVDQTKSDLRNAYTELESITYEMMEQKKIVERLKTDYRNSSLLVRAQKLSEKNLIKEGVNRRQI